MCCTYTCCIGKMVRFLFVFVLSFACSRVSDGQPLANHKISLEAAQMEQRILASIRSIVLPQLSTSDTCGSAKHNSEYLSALEDKIKNQTKRLDALEKRIDKQHPDKHVCRRLLEKMDLEATVHVFEDRCYLFVQQHLAWSNAQERCQLVGANLVSVMSKDQQDFIVSVIRPSGYGVWIGARRRTTDNKYAWIGNGLLLGDAYTNWSPGKPNSDEDCVGTYVNGWYDFSCSDQLRCICAL